LVNPQTGKSFEFVTDYKMHNYAKIALEMRANGSDLATQDQVEWGILKGKTVPQEIMFQFPNLLAKYGV